MLVCDYIVESIDGDYAHLRRTDLPEEELKLVARALLPFEITEGCFCHYIGNTGNIFTTGVKLAPYMVLRQTVSGVEAGLASERMTRRRFLN